MEDHMFSWFTHEIHSIIECIKEEYDKKYDTSIFLHKMIFMMLNVQCSFSSICKRIQVQAYVSPLGVINQFDYAGARNFRTTYDPIIYTTCYYSKNHLLWVFF